VLPKTRAIAPYSVHQISKAADAVEAISDRALIHPCSTRWNSRFDAVNRLLELSDKLPALDLPRLRAIEMEFLFVSLNDMAMSPLVATLVASTRRHFMFLLDDFAIACDATSKQCSSCA